jgi:CRISPR-associated protein Cas10/Cmr2 subtype III-B
MSNFWKHKLAAYLHDPPSKPFNIAEHWAMAETLIRNAGFEPADVAWFFDKVCDHTAAAADRVICPKSSVLKAEWNESASFKHPLGGGELHFEQPIRHAEAEKQVAALQPHNCAWDQFGDQRDWAKFFVHWRLWRQRCAEEDPRLAHLPADTRVPDHTIWTHCSIVSALQTCVKIANDGPNAEVREFKPAFLLVQIGPVQEFIAQARSTRDLWSGSYLLSWLIAHGIKAITDQVGPDCVLFPALRGQPLFDFLHKESLYEKLNMWDKLRHSQEQILTPNLPNRFLAIVPAGQAQQLAVAAEKAMAEELKRIGDACASWLKVEDTARPRWGQQIAQFLTVHWQTWKWDEDVAKAIKGHAELERAYEAATQGIPPADLDPRNYRHQSWQANGVWKSKVSNTPPVIDNPGFAWAAHYAKVDSLLAARRNTRDFDAWAAADTNRTGAVKDMLSGKEEVIGSEDWQKALADMDGHYFKSGEKLGALNLIKRVWHKAYLQEVKGLEVYRAVRFESMPEIAAGSPDPLPESPKYVAIIALDGDSMGKWVSGELSPKWKDQLAKEAVEYFSKEHSEAAAPKARQQLLDARRPVSPSYHLQLSEALANFALYLAGPIVEHFDGQLIYAGGDDVLAMLPAEQALPCARALRMAFRGDPQLHDTFKGALEAKEGQWGFVGLNADAEIFQRIKRFVPRGYPLIVPGQNADLSAGIAIGHMHAPLQNLVEAARRAEKRAKKEYRDQEKGIGAFAISLFKRSGETIQWGAKWDTAAIKLAEEFTTLTEDEKLSGRFPYALAELLGKYDTPIQKNGKLEPFRIEATPDFDAIAVIRKDLEHVTRQPQQGKNVPLSFVEIANQYLEDCRGHRLDDFLGPFLTTTFINRGGGE